ncbi:unnamed protein product [Cochlearia groenlandica]
MEPRRSLRLSEKAKTENNLQSPTTTLKNVNYVVPLDIQIEILNRLPVKSLVRLLLLSKTIAQVTKSEGFLKSYPFRSLKQPCDLLIAFGYRNILTRRVTYEFYSSSSLSSWSSIPISTSFLSRITCPSRNQLQGSPNYYVNGLLNIGSVICNPCTGRIAQLPIIKSATTSRQIRRFFGYEPVDNQYKVLCISLSKEGIWSDFQVYTLGAKPKVWRRIQCGIPDHGAPFSLGLCIDGVVYYLAHTGRVIRILINYHGKVALPIPSYDTIDLYVFEAGKHNLFETAFDNLPELHLCMKGVNHAGDVILAPRCSKEVSVILYNREERACKKMEIEFDKQHGSCDASFFVGYMESHMLV